MKKIWIIFSLLCVACLLNACAQPQALITKGLSQSPAIAKDAVWLQVDSINGEMPTVPSGTVVISEELASEMSQYAPETVFAVAVSFASMIPENYLDTIEHDGRSANEHRQLASRLAGIAPRKAEEHAIIYNALRYGYYDDCLEQLSFAGEKDFCSIACKEEFFFYTYLTAAQIQDLTCAENEALYVFSPGLFK